jgi:hypothetical protein
MAITALPPRLTAMMLVRRMGLAMPADTRRRRGAVKAAD